MNHATLSAHHTTHTTHTTHTPGVGSRRCATRPATARCVRRHGDAGSIELARVVSATSLGVEAEIRSMRRPTVPNYALRRLVVGVAALFALLVGSIVAVGAMTGFTGTSAVAADVAPSGPSAGTSAEAPATVHVAQPGDTLWSIAEEYRGEVSRDRYIQALIGINDGVTIQSGQAVWLP